MFRGFATISFYADDVPAAADWYAELLGVAPYHAVPPARHRRCTWSSASATRPTSSASSTGGTPPTADLVARRRRHVLARGRPGGDAGAAARDGRHRVRAAHSTRDEGFVTASVVDPFGNVLGIMHNPHYLEVLAGHES